MTGSPGFVRRGASVLAGVSGRDSIDRQDAETLALRYRELICALGGYRFAVERPGNVHREVPLEDGAGRGNCLARVHRLVAEREREDLRSNCDRGSRVRNKNFDETPLRELRSSRSSRVVNDYGDREQGYRIVRQCDDGGWFTMNYESL